MSRELPLPPELREDITEEEAEKLIEEAEHRLHEKEKKKKEIKKAVQKAAKKVEKKLLSDEKAREEDLEVVIQEEIQVFDKPRSKTRIKIGRDIREEIIKWLATPEDERIDRRKLLDKLGITPYIYKQIIKDKTFQAEFEEYMSILLIEKKSKIFSEHLKKAEKGDTSAIDLYYRKYEGWDPKEKKDDFASINFTIKLVDLDGNLIKKIKNEEI